MHGGEKGWMVDKGGSNGKEREWDAEDEDGSANDVKAESEVDLALESLQR